MSTVAAGKETGKETGDDGRAANDDELWGLDLTSPEFFNVFRIKMNQGSIL